MTLPATFPPTHGCNSPLFTLCFSRSTSWMVIAWPSDATKEVPECSQTLATGVLLRRSVMNGKCLPISGTTNNFAGLRRTVGAGQCVRQGERRLQARSMGLERSTLKLLKIPFRYCFDVNHTSEIFVYTILAYGLWFVASLQSVAGEMLFILWYGWRAPCSGKCVLGTWRLTHGEKYPALEKMATGNG